ncbi:MAG: XRE family transcriptional regulator [Verrucomicrobiaceae bacterium]|nr:MAG: XRE family transcriptional regulator [Verrucomicrobiaceae bacterium]
MIQLAIDTQWFHERIKERGLSQRRLAELMEMEPGALNRMLKGSRKMCIQEASDLARLLEIPVETVIIKGMSVALPGQRVSEES